MYTCSLYIKCFKDNNFYDQKFFFFTSSSSWALKWETLYQQEMLEM